MSERAELVEAVARSIWAERVRHAKEANGIDLEAYEQYVGGRNVAEMNNVKGEAEAAIDAYERQVRG